MEEWWGLILFKDYWVSCEDSKFFDYKYSVDYSSAILSYQSVHLA